MINKVILIGNMGADPEVRALEGGTKVARLRIATTERIYNRQTQETKEHTEWHNVTLWRNLADVADRFIRKGSQVYVEGSLRTRDWTDKDGNKRYTTEIVANDLKMLGRRNDAPTAGNENSSYGTSSYGGNSYGAPAPQQHTAAPVTNNMTAAVPDEVDDLPF